MSVSAAVLAVFVAASAGLTVGFVLASIFANRAQHDIETADHIATQELDRTGDASGVPAGNRPAGTTDDI